MGVNIRREESERGSIEFPPFAKNAKDQAPSIRVQDRNRKTKTGPPVLRVIFLLIASTITATGQEQDKRYDGTWWSAATTEHRLGWLAGYINCATSKPGKKDLGLISWYTLEPEVTKFYSANPNKSRLPIRDVVAQIIAQPAMRMLMSERAKDKGGERVSGTIFDGDYWRQSMLDHREGFIQGFLACYGELKTRTARFSKADTWYASEISKSFGVKEDDPAEIDLKRESVAVATVLFKFKDATSKTSHPIKNATTTKRCSITLGPQNRRG